MNKKNEITAIKVPLRRPDRRSIYLDGKYAFSVSEGIFLKQHLKAGTHLDQDQINLLKADDDRLKIKESALKLLGYRQRSEKELRDRLRRKGWENEEIDPVIKELDDMGYLNDLEFARMLARDRIMFRYLGPAALRNELYKTGVDKEIIQKVVDEAYSSMTPREIILKFLQKKRISLEKPMEPKEKSRLINMLKRRGYKWGDIESIISIVKSR